VTGRRQPGRARRRWAVSRSAKVSLRASDDRGSYTVELAAGLPALILLLLAGLTIETAAVTQNRCESAARDAALTAARGGDGYEAAARTTPPGTRTTITYEDGSAPPDSVTVVVEARIKVLGGVIPPLSVSGRAVAAREPEDIP
jgi:hypothetical protein